MPTRNQSSRSRTIVQTMEEHLASATGGSFCKKSTWLGQKKQLSLTTKELSGAIT